MSDYDPRPSDLGPYGRWFWFLGHRPGPDGRCVKCSPVEGAVTVIAGVTVVWCGHHEMFEDREKHCDR